jgi:hypothetical protein
VYLNAGDVPNKSKACEYAFRALMENLADVTTKADRAEIARQFLASRPRKPSLKQLKRTVASQRAELEQLRASQYYQLASTRTD